MKIDKGYKFINLETFRERNDCTVSKFWSKTTASLQPYVPGEQPKDKKYIKLNTNENPYSPSPKVVEAINNLDKDMLKLYPDPNSEDLLEAIGEYYGVDKKQVFLGNGSDEVLALSFMTFFDEGDEISFPDITYSFYEVYAKLFKLDVNLVELEEDFSIPVDKFIGTNNGIIIPNPNAPTSRYLELSEIERILNGNPEKIVIIDEAYIDFGGETAIKLVDKYENLLVVQTFSKSRSLAGLRLGFAIGNEELIDGLNRVKNSFNSYPIDRVAMISGVEAIKDEEYFKETRDKIVATREAASKHLEDLGFLVTPSKANFIFISHKEVPAEDIFLKLKEKGVLVRFFKKDRINNYLRVSIGTDEEMEIFVEKLKEIL